MQTKHCCWIESFEIKIFTIKGGQGWAKLGKLDFHAKKLNNKHCGKKFDKKLRKSCTKILQSFL